MNSDRFDRSVLSNRENQIVDLAIEGLTDIQIALKMGISPSTVNSYWVRIRGKLGAQTRTELVSRALRSESGVLQDRIERLERAAALRNEVLADRGAVELFQAAFDALPEAAGILNEQGHIVYCNQRLVSLMRRKSSDLIDLALRSILTVAGPTSNGSIPDGLPIPGVQQLGIREVLYARCGDGTKLRVILSIDAQETANGMVGAFVIRPFLSVVDSLRRQAREARNLDFASLLARSAGGEGEVLRSDQTLRNHDQPF